MAFKLVGKQEGLHIAIFENGEEKRLTDDELAELQGGKKVAELSDKRKHAKLKEDLAAAEKFATEQETLRLEVEAKVSGLEEALAKATAEIQKLAEDLERQTALASERKSIIDEMKKAAKKKEGGGE